MVRLDRTIQKQLQLLEKIFIDLLGPILDRPIRPDDEDAVLQVFVTGREIFDRRESDQPLRG